MIGGRTWASISSSGKAGLLTTAAVTLAAASGYLASVAISAPGSAAAAGRTVTITVTGGGPGPTGAEGPAGPQGPTGARGPAGSFTCPAGFEEGELVINHPGGHVAIWTCLEQ